MRFSPRQCDLMIVAGRVVMKMLPVLQRIWLQMPEPKWCISMGACASQRRRLRHLRRRAGHRPLHSGGRVRPRLSAAAGAVAPVGHRLAGEDPADRHAARARNSPSARSRKGPSRWRWNCRRPTRSSRRAISRRQPATAELHRYRPLGEREPTPPMSATKRPSTQTACERFGADGFTTSEFRDNRRVHRAAGAAATPCWSASRTTCGFDMLVELTAVDYLHYPDAKDRFGVVYGLLEHHDRRARLT